MPNVDEPGSKTPKEIASLGEKLTSAATEGKKWKLNEIIDEEACVAKKVKKLKRKTSDSLLQKLIEEMRKNLENFEQGLAARIVESEQRLATRILESEQQRSVKSQV